MPPLRPFLSRPSFSGATHPQRPPPRQARVPLLRRRRHSLGNVFLITTGR